MTGQVKEDLIARLGEMGVAVTDGRLCFRRDLLSRGELLNEVADFPFYDVDGDEDSLDLEIGTLVVFTICSVPVVVHGDGPARIETTFADGPFHGTLEGPRPRP